MVAGTTLRAILDILRKDPGVDGDAQRVGQLSWMLFLKLVDEHEIGREAASRRYQSAIPDALRWQAWADSEEGLPAEALIDFVNGKLFPGLRALPGVDRVSDLVRTAFVGAQNHMKSGDLLRQAAHKIDRLALQRPKSREDVAIAYEGLLNDLGSPRSAAGHHTPRPLTTFMVEATEPHPGETLLDPACGTGGFLASAVRYMRHRYVETLVDERKVVASLHGIEKDPFTYLLCATNLMLNGVESTVLLEDALASLTSRRGAFDVVLSNPISHEVTDEAVLKVLPAELRSGDSLDIFLHLAIKRLRRGGRGAVLVPETMLFLDGAGAKPWIRRKLLQECNLHTIVRLPGGALPAYPSLGVDILFFTKGEPTKEVWYYRHPSPPGHQRYSRTRPLRSEDFEPERQWWHSRRETEQAWKVSVGAIAANEHNLHVPMPSRYFGRGPSRVAWLKLRDFRGFDSLVLELPKVGPAVLVGVNGAGKSTVLDAIAMHLSSFAALACGLSAQKAEVQLGEADIKVGRDSTAVEVMVELDHDQQVWELAATLARGIHAPGKEVVAQASMLREALLRTEGQSLPALCYYPATRALGDGAISGKRQPHRIEQLEVYERALGHGPGPFSDFIHWFREAEDAENEGRLRIAPTYRSPRLEVVRRALERFLSELGDSHFSNLRMERIGVEEGPRTTSRPAELVLDKDGVRLAIHQFSEGERNTILLVADLARRLAIANPLLQDPLRGEGIVLIDEIDLHLHPAWQRGIVPALAATFPGCQLIVSTHSPQALSRIPKENVFILENFALVRVTPHTYGRDTNSILGEVMGIPERPADIEQKIRHASMLIDEERLEEARAALGELTSILGDQDHVVVRLRTLASFLGDEG